MTQEFEILNKTGMHVRPAGALAKLCQRFESDITVSKDGFEVSGKSVLGLLTLEAPCGTKLAVNAEGPDAEEALRAIGELFASCFGLPGD